MVYYIYHPQSQSGDFHPQTLPFSHFKRWWDYNYDDLFFLTDISTLHHNVLFKPPSPQFTLLSMTSLSVFSMSLHILTNVMKVTRLSTQSHKSKATTCTNHLFQKLGFSCSKIRYRLLFFKKLLQCHTQVRTRQTEYIRKPN